MTHHCKSSCAKAVAMRTARPARARRSRAPPTADRQKLRLAPGGKRNGPGTLGGAAGTVPDRCAFGRRAHKASAAAVVPISCWNSFHANLHCCFDQERLVTL